MTFNVVKITSVLFPVAIIYGFIRLDGLLRINSLLNSSPIFKLASVRSKESKAIFSEYQFTDLFPVWCSSVSFTSFPSDFKDTLFMKLNYYSDVVFGPLFSVLSLTYLTIVFLTHSNLG